MSHPDAGLEKLTCDLEAAREAVDAIDAEVEVMSFDLSNPASVAGAIQTMEALVDERLPLIEGNAVNGPLRNDLKEKYRRRFLKWAAAAKG